MLILPADLTTFCGDDGRPILSNREIEVFVSLGDGEMCKEIAYRLFLEVKTVQGYVKKLRIKLNIRDLHRLTWLATRWACGVPIEVQIQDPYVSVKSTS